MWRSRVVGVTLRDDEKANRLGEIWWFLVVFGCFGLFLGGVWLGFYEVF